MRSIAKQSLVIATLGIAALAAATAPAVAQTGGELVVATNGGSLSDAQEKAFIQPFEKATGIKVTVANQDSTVGPLKAQVNAGNVKWDVVYLAPIDSSIAVEDDLLQPIDYGTVQRAGLREGAAQEKRLASLYTVSVIGWNSKLLQGVDGPKALFDLKKYPGKRALRSTIPYGVLEIALLADGVDPAKLYPLDVDRAFRKLDTIKDHAIFFTANEQGIQLLASGQATIGIVPNGRVFNARKAGRTLDYTFNGGVNFIDYWVVPKGAKNTANAMKFLDFISKPEGQVTIGNIMAYGGNNAAADSLYSPELRKDMPTDPENRKKLVELDSVWWSQNIRTVLQRWQTWLAS